MKLKNSLIILGTLVIGIIIGFLISGRLTHMRMERMKTDFVDNGMRRHFMRVIEPSPEQMEKIEPIFNKYSEIRRENLKDHYRVQKEIFNDFENELKPYLNADQIDKLEKMKSKNKGRFSGMQNNKRPNSDRHRDKKNRHNRQDSLK